MSSDKINNDTISKTVSIKAPASKVWHVLTDPAEMKLWLSDAEIEIVSDWMVGSPIVFKSKVNGAHEYSGKILQMETEKVFQYSSWSRITRLPDVPENYAVIEFRLNEANDETSLTVTHSNLIAAAAPEHSGFYWNITLEMIRKLAEKE